MIWSSLVKSACVAIALSGFSPPQAGAIEMQGFEPDVDAERRDDLESVYRASRRDGCGAARRRLPSRRDRGRRLSGRLSGRSLSWRRLPAAESTMAEASTAAVTAAGRGPAGIAGDRAARSRPAPQSVCSQPELRRPMRALPPAPGCAGTIPIRAIATASGTPASRQSNWGPIGAAEIGRPGISGASTRFSGRR